MGWTTLIDDQGLSARIGADHLGHSNVSMTQDRYMARGRVHAEVRRSPGPDRRHKR
jgi:integrase